MQLAPRSEVLDPNLPLDPARPDGWVVQPGDTLRALPFRRTYRARAAGRAVVVKEYAPRGWRRLRALAEREAAAAQAVAILGVPVVRPLAWARFEDGRQILLLDEEPGARTLQALVLEGALRGARRHGVARNVGALLAALQNAGVRHADPHAGNILVRPDGTVLLADARALRPGHCLRPAQRAADLARFACFFLVHASRVDLLVFWGTYAVCSGFRPEEAEALRRATLARVPAAFTALARSRARRAMRRGRPLHDGGFRGLALAALDDADLRTAVAAANDLAVAPDVIKRSPTGWTLAIGKELVLKVHLPKKRTRPLRDLLRGTRAERAVVAAEALRHRGSAPPEIVAVLREGRWSRRSLLLMRRVADALPVEEVFASLGVSDAREAAAAAGRTLRRLHDWGLRHRDLKRENVLLSPDGRSLRLLDLDGIRQLRRPLDGRRRARDLGRLAGSIVDSRALPTGLRMRALAAYLGGEFPAGIPPDRFGRILLHQAARIRARRLAP